MKETPGPNPNNIAEWIDPLYYLLHKGFPANRIKLVITFRNPLDTLNSWQRMWKWTEGQFPLDGFVKSFEDVVKTMTLARLLDIPITPYIHEWLRDFGSENVMKMICSRLGLTYNPSVLKWGNEDAYFDAKTVKYDIPPKEWVQGSLGIKSGGRGGLYWKSIANQFSESELARLTHSDEFIAVQRIYKNIEEIAREILSPK